MENILIAVLGTAMGSFLNVVIHRLPRRESIVRPGSHCPSCGHRIPPWLNVPILSYLLLRGKCRWCGAAIPVRYPLVEALTPALLLGVHHFYGFGWLFFKYGLLILLLIPITFIDLDHRLILDRITLPGLLLGLALSIGEAPSRFYLPLAGMLAGGGFLWLVALLGQGIYGQESMGGGDIKLGAMAGAFLSVQNVVLALLMAFFIAAAFVLVGMLVGRLQRRSAIPFGPFIAAGALVVIGFKQQIIAFYLSLMVK